MFSNGQAVTQILPAAIKGTVSGFGFDPSTGNVTVLVSYTDTEGNAHQQYFQQSDLEATPA